MKFSVTVLAQSVYENVLLNVWCTRRLKWSTYRTYRDIVWRDPLTFRLAQNYSFRITYEVGIYRRQQHINLIDCPLQDCILGSTLSWGAIHSTFNDQNLKWQPNRVFFASCIPPSWRDSIEPGAGAFPSRPLGVNKTQFLNDLGTQHCLPFRNIEWKLLWNLCTVVKW